MAVFLMVYGAWIVTGLVAWSWMRVRKQDQPREHFNAELDGNQETDHAMGQFAGRLPV